MIGVARFTSAPAVWRTLFSVLVPPSLVSAAWTVFALGNGYTGAISTRFDEYSTGIN